MHPSSDEHAEQVFHGKLGISLPDHFRSDGEYFAWTAGSSGVAGRGLEMIGIGNKDSVEMIERESAIARGEDGNGKFGIGLLAWVLDQKPELLDAAIAQRPFMVVISFGPVRAHVERLHRAGILAAKQVNYRRAALEAQDEGVDLIVAQGNEAGGHTGFVGTLPAMQIAGGCTNASRGCGWNRNTRRFGGRDCGWSCCRMDWDRVSAVPEAETTDATRARIAAEDETGTIHTPVFDRVNRLAWPAEFPGRALRNATRRNRMGARRSCWRILMRSRDFGRELRRGIMTSRRYLRGRQWAGVGGGASGRGRAVVGGWG